MGETQCCGCTHNNWGMLFLFCVLNLFLALVMFPAAIEIYSTGSQIRSARTNVENAASTYDNSVLFDPTAQAITMTTPATVVLTNFLYKNPIDYAKAMEGYVEAHNYWLRLRAAYLPDATENNVAFMPFTYRLVATAADGNGVVTTADMYFDPNGGATPYYVSRGGFVTSDTQKPTILVCITKGPTPANASVAAYNTGEKYVTTVVGNSLGKLETLGAFFFLQGIMNVIMFGYLYLCYKKGEQPTWGVIIALIGLILFFIGWTSGFERRSLVNLNGLFNFWLTNSGAFTNGNYAGGPYVGMIILFWLFEIAYCLYVNKDGGK